MLIPDTTPQRKPPAKNLTDADAVNIWIARWLGIRRADLIRRYACDPRRIYEIWEGKKFPASRARALIVFKERHPTLTDRIDFGNHKRIPRHEPHPDQLTMFTETKA